MYFKKSCLSYFENTQILSYTPVCLMIFHETLKYPINKRVVWNDRLL